MGKINSDMDFPHEKKNDNAVIRSTETGDGKKECSDMDLGQEQEYVRKRKKN